MAFRRIWTIDVPNEAAFLRSRAKTVARFDKDLQRLIADLWDTLEETPYGAGLAAPQIGVSARVFVAKHDYELIALVNPELVESSGQWFDVEACLSIPGFVGFDIPRAEWVTVKGYDANGRAVVVHADGWLGRIVQHELDHLDGILYLDRLLHPKKLHRWSPDDEDDEDDEIDDEDVRTSARTKGAANNRSAKKGGGGSGRRFEAVRASRVASVNVRKRPDGPRSHNKKPSRRH